MLSIQNLKRQVPDCKPEDVNQLKILAVKLEVNSYGAATSQV